MFNIPYPFQQSTMSSALSSAKNRRANQQPTPVGKTSEFAQPPRQIKQQPVQGPIPGQTAGLSLQQVIEIYGRRLNQLESFMNKTQSQQQIDPATNSRVVPGSSSGPYLAQMQDLIDAKIRDYNDLLFNELEPLREGLSSSKAAVSEVDFSEFHSRCQMLAEEVYQIKDMVLKLQAFTMSVNQKLLEKAGILGDNNSPEGGLTIPFAPVEDESDDTEENV